jgi:cytochrome c-type biogenesis protein CcmH/NrfF
MLAGKYGAALGFNSTDVENMESKIIDHIQSGKSTSEIVDLLV